MVGESGKQLTTDWYVRAFDRLYPIIYSHRSVEQARREVDFAARVLSLKSEDTVLDLCCGAARHLTHLRRKCKQSVGLDYSWFLLQEACKHLPFRVPLVRGDMRKIPFSSCFDVVCNFFTSFGYFMSDEENALVLGEISRVLRPEGRFFIDYVNSEHIMNSLVPESKRQSGVFEVVETRWIEDGRVNKRMEVYQNGTLYETLTESVRLYSPREFQNILETQGLQIKEFYGDYDGSPLSPAKPRMIVVGRKR
jgi:ubiquinone/menaquinone biosynthesis C-methylase UbiE